jgi:hypothetical protein
MRVFDKLIHLSDSKENLGFDESNQIKNCSENVPCPGNRIQTCGCLSGSILYPMVIDSSNIGRQFFLQ